MTDKDPVVDDGIWAYDGIYAVPGEFTIGNAPQAAVPKADPDLREGILDFDDEAGAHKVSMFEAVGVERKDLQDPSELMDLECCTYARDLRLFDGKLTHLKVMLNVLAIQRRRLQRAEANCYLCCIWVQTAKPAKVREHVKKGIGIV